MNQNNPTEQEIRNELLQVPDYAIIKFLAKYCKDLEQSCDNKDVLIDKWHELYKDMELRHETMIEVAKEYVSHDAYMNIKNETKRRLKKLRKQ